MAYLDKRVVAVLHEMAGGVVDFIDFSYVAASGGSTFALCDDVDAPN